MNKRQFAYRVLAVALFCVCFIASAAAQNATPVYFAPDPGLAKAQISGESVSLSNRTLQATWITSEGKFRGAQFRDLIANRAMAAQISPFVLLLGDGHAISASEMKIVNVPSVTDLVAQPDASQLSERLAGKSVVVELEDAAGTIHAIWRGVLRNGSNYLRQEVTLSAKNEDVPIAQVRLIDWDLRDARVVGTVKGSPVVAGDMFVGFEHPLSACAVGSHRVRCELQRELPLRAARPMIYSSVIGVTPPGQLRRGFLRYLERERAHPYRTFLHYNSWYDYPAYFKYTEADALSVINAFGTELVKKRGVHLSSFLYDDGWDDSTTLWKFHSGFPDGFAKVRAAAAQYGAAPGVWMSPWGGYGTALEDRLTAARAADLGYEVVGRGFALSGEKYYRLFRDTCLEMIRKYGVNQFKFDGTGNATRVIPGSQFDSDFDAAINLIQELRAEKTDLYINLTTGTYASPFWLRYTDTIWRGGHDHGFAGVGSSRERWITFRDANTYEHVVLNGPLYPLNSLMLCGLIYAKYAEGLETDPQGDFQNEVRSFFGTGTQLQEMYITPSLLSPANWDNLAEAAKWSNENADVLVDTHWVGGDPGQLEAYGWASWKPEKATLVLRNPSDKAQSMAVDIGKAFELPAGAATSYRLHSPWKEDRSEPALQLAAGHPHTFELKPFQVLVLQSEQH